MPPFRPEFIREGQRTNEFGVVEKPLGLGERLYNNGAVRKAIILIVLAVLWEAYARRLNNPLLVPTFSETVVTFFDAIRSGELPGKAVNSIRLLFQGYAWGLGLAFLLTALAMLTRIGNDLLETLTSMFNPLPAIALLPLALIWFGLGGQEHHLRADPFGAVGRGAQHPFRLPLGLQHHAHGRPQLRPHAASPSS